MLIDQNQILLSFFVLILHFPSFLTSNSRLPWMLNRSVGPQVGAWLLPNGQWHLGIGLLWRCTNKDSEPPVASWFGNRRG